MNGNEQIKLYTTIHRLSPSNKYMNIGDKAPEVLGINEKGEEIHLSDYKGKKLYCISIPKTAHQAVRPRPAICATITVLSAKLATR